MPVLDILLGHWRLSLAFILTVALGGYIAILRAERDHARNEVAELHVLVAQIKAAGEAQERATKAKIEQDKKDKEMADEENKSAMDSLHADIERLRNQRTRAVILPAPASCPAGSSGADRYAAEYQRAYRELVDGLRAQGDRGSEATVNLNTAKRWAQSPK